MLAYCTKMAAKVIEHPTDGLAAMRWKDSFKVRPHPSKDVTSEITSKIPAHAASLSARINQRKGAPHPLGDFIPSAMSGKFKNEKQMIREGWFSSI